MVLIGAGYDGRALRFSDAHVKWIEVDHPATQADKINRLARIGASSEQTTFVGIDLMTGDLSSELDRAGHESAQSTMWICEGLFPYLPRPAINQLCETLRRRSTPDGTLVFNVLIRDAAWSGGRLIRAGVDRLLAAIGEQRLSEFAQEDVEAFLTKSGWSIDVAESTPRARSDNTYMLAVSAGPSTASRSD